MTWRDGLETAATGVSLLAGAAGLLGTFSELFRGRRIRLAEHAFHLVDDLQKDPLASAALQMLDWSGRTYRSVDANYTIRRDDLPPALVHHRDAPHGFTPPQQFVRDAFDALLTRLDGIDHAVRIGMVREQDLAPGLRYWANLIVQNPPTIGFANAYDYSCTELLARLAPPAKRRRPSR